MAKDSIILKNITLDDKPTDIIVSDGIIRKILPSGHLQELMQNEGDAPFVTHNAEVVDCYGKTAMPGLINMHTHAAMSLMRGIEEDVVFQDWLDAIWKIEANIDSDFVYWGTKVAAIEMLKTGTTTFNDQYWSPTPAKVAAKEMGIRPVISYVVLDKSDPSEASRQKGQCERMYEASLKWNDDAIFSVAFHAVYSVSEEMILWASEFAKKHDLLLHIHLCETQKEVHDCMEAHGGLSPVEYLDRLGVLDSRTIAAHSLWLSDNDIRILGERKVNCVHNILSNTKLASGYKFRYNELRDAGANVCIGTDGCASSNNLDILEAMKTAAVIQKAWRNDPKAWPLDELLKCATVNAAKALRINTGEIAEGKAADILIIDTDSSFFLSPGSFLANFIYSAHSDCIESVMVNGKFVMRERKILEEKDILRQARKMIRQISE